MEKKINLFLVSDSTGETVTNVARAVFAHFENIDVVSDSGSETHNNLIFTSCILFYKSFFFEMRFLPVKNF